MNGTDLAADVMQYVAHLAPFWIIFGGVIFADLMIDFIVKLFKRGKIKW